MGFELSGVPIMLERSDFGISDGAAQGVSVEQGVMVVVGVWCTQDCLGVFGDGVVGVMSFVVVAESVTIVFSRLSGVPTIIQVKLHPRICCGQ